ncbi:MAG: acetyl-CoA carboxylase biotin carboxyl carrier protein [Acidobacteriota bacterium]
MDSKEVRDLIDFISKSKFVEFEMEKEGFRLRLVKGQVSSPVVPQAGMNGESVPTLHEPVEKPGEALPESKETDQVEFIRSPIVGTFFLAPSPNSPPFVEVGDRIRKGQTLCIIEAMKVMNEIESEQDGEILEIGVANGQPVEYGEVLFRILPLPAPG